MFPYGLNPKIPTESQALADTRTVVSARYLQEFRDRYCDRCHAFGRLSNSEYERTVDALRGIAQQVDIPRLRAKTKLIQHVLLDKVFLSRTLVSLGSLDEQVEDVERLWL